MRYLVVNGLMSGTGIKDPHSEIDPSPQELGLSSHVISLIEQWLKRYADAMMDGYKNKKENERLDQEGIEIARAVRSELLETKVEYYSDVLSKRILLD